MLNLFKIEWLKIKTYRTFWLLYLSFVIFFPALLFFIAYKFMNARFANFEEMTLKALAGSPFVFPKIWHTSSYMAGYFFLVIGMLYILLITNEVQYRTHRQNIIDGWSRIDFLKAKFTLLIFFVITTTIVVFLSAMLIGYIYTPAGFQFTDGLYYVGYFIIMATVYLMVAFLIAILVKRTGLSIIIYFVLVCIVDNLLWAALTIQQNQMGFFMPVEVADTLIPNPSGLLRTRTIPDIVMVFSALGYATIYGWIIVNYFRKTDLKT